MLRIETQRFYTEQGIDLTSDWWGEPNEVWAQNLLAFNEAHQTVRRSINESLHTLREGVTDDRERIELEEGIGLTELFMDLSEPTAQIFKTILEDPNARGSWRKIHAGATQEYETVLKTFMADSRLGAYKTELSLLLELGRVHTSRDYYRINDAMANEAYKKYKAGKMVIVVGISSAARDRVAGLGGNLKVVEPDIRLYEPSAHRAEFDALIKKQERKINALHPGRHRHGKPMSVDLVMQLGWIPSIAYGEALTKGLFVSLPEINKQTSLAERIFALSNLDTDRKKIQELMTYILTLHERIHLHYWEGDNPFDAAIYEEVFTDIATTLIVSRCKRYDRREILSALLASYLSEVTVDRSQVDPAQWRYSMSSNIVVSGINQFGLMTWDGHQLRFNLDNYSAFIRRLQEIHKGLWGKDRMIKKQVLNAAVTPEVIELKELFIEKKLDTAVK